jgi:CRP/FNR family cyclic AMP-dependent transcriptional regulator
MERYSQWQHHPGAVPFGTPSLDGPGGGVVSAPSESFDTDIDAMAKKATAAFNPNAYLHSPGPSRVIVRREKDETFFAQGDPADSVFYLQKGRVKISVVSPSGREATIRLVSAGDFFGERAMAQPAISRVTTATAVTPCTALSIARPEFLRVMREEQSFSYLFSQFLLACSLRTQADLVDQLFNRAEKRLARLLLTLAEHSHPGQESPLLAPISQEALASMIGSTRPRVNTFMTRFRKLGFIEYNGRIRVHKSLLTVFLRD